MNEETMLHKIDAKVDALMVSHARLETFVREDAKRSRKRLDDLEETVNCPESGLVVLVDRARQKFKMMWAVAFIAVTAWAERIFR